jgi:hypothetical protein
LIPIDRVAADRPFQSGKHRRHGMNLQVISAPDGEIVWVFGLLPGAVHDLTAARIWGIICHLAAAGLITWPSRATTALATPCSPPTGAEQARLPKDANLRRCELTQSSSRQGGKKATLYGASPAGGQSVATLTGTTGMPC